MFSVGVRRNNERRAPGPESARDVPLACSGCSSLRRRPVLFDVQGDERGHSFSTTNALLGAGPVCAEAWPTGSESGEQYLLAKRLAIRRFTASVPVARCSTAGPSPRSSAA
eukprot:3703733-Prymnesium_polylepis.2